MLSIGLLPLLADPLAFLVAFAACAFGLVMHNVAQAWLANRYKDPGPARYGFLSLEPRVHLDVLGVIFLILLGFGFPRPVPFRLYGAKEAQVALMGPLAFFLMAFIYGLLAALLGGGATGSFAEGLSRAMGVMLLHAAIFLFPVPPLDGARVVYAVGSPQARRFMDQLASYGPLGFLVIFLVLNFAGVTSAVIYGLSGLLGTIYRAIGL